MSPIPGRRHALHKPLPRGECPHLPSKAGWIAWQVVCFETIELLCSWQTPHSF
jgi:hypothetical protein